MSSEDKKQGQSGGVNISGGSVSSGGDIVGGDKITVGDIGVGAAVAAGRGASANVIQSNNTAVWDEWQKKMNEWIEQRAALSADDKQDAKEQVANIKNEAMKGDKADPQRLERFINRLAEYGPDIFEVVVATAQNPLLGIGLVLKKISDRAKLERAPKPA
jgi:hypothetical protein